MSLQILRNIFQKNRSNDAIVWNDQIYSYGDMLQKLDDWGRFIDEHEIMSGTVVALQADFSPNAAALMLALVERNAIIVPLTKSVITKKKEFLEIAQCEIEIAISESDNVTFNRFENTSANHEHYEILRTRNHSGLVLFSSGSTGKSKAAVHDFELILEKFTVPRKALRTISFLLYDHIGGINTMLHTFYNAGCLITVAERTPDAVARSIEKYQVELLPTSPTFLRLLLLSDVSQNYNLKSLNLITYGTEPMPESTLQQLHQTFSWIKIQQTYGLSEIGILRSKSKDSGSLWVKIGGEGFETRVVDNILQIKSKSAMLGYLNAPAPFTDDGWFITGDMVEVDGEYMKILGRKSELINVGGQKVYPAEVEAVIEELPEVVSATVFGEDNMITGKIVCARVQLRNDNSGSDKETIKRIRLHCKQKLESFKIPMRIDFIETKNHNERFKKLRAIN
ncbi:MAG: fatty acid--CoA ligase family protein [Planctomycetaceae bacterium]|jgi:acyl-coenzyme A synthetase/AMP-(fatty) acid ligase|nr:fatty acid--CoA ligase family protein [Planctomycetaceae bacterium]